jgi:Fur family ferric uptake transcriptional regulator
MVTRSTATKAPRAAKGTTDVAPAASKQSKALQDNLRASGLRATQSRMLVLQRLRAASSPVSHADLSEQLASEGINHVTVYRNLNDLAEAGLARRIDVGDHVWRFEPMRDGGGHPAGEHAHFVCDSCGDVECLPGVSVAVAGAQKVPKALRKNAIEVQLKGRCDRCE